MSSSSRSIFTLGAATALTLAAVGAGYYYYTKQDEGCCNSNNKKSDVSSSSSKSAKAYPQIPVIDLNLFFSKDQDSAKYREECAKVADAFHKYGVVIVKDPRVSNVDNEKFISMMEKYFELSDGRRDARPEYNFQVGVTPELTEKAREHSKLIQSFKGDNAAISPATPEYDPKWRFFWRIGPIPEKTDFPVLNQDQVIPPEFPRWTETMDMWGYKMLDAIFALSEMAAVGLNMPKDAFTSRLQNGPHLLAPTGSNYNKYDKEGTVLAAFHYDLNFMTIHGKCRYPGLYVWTRDGTKMPVSVPEGCLIVQASKQFEYLTGGYVMAGFHEVVINENTKKVIEEKRAKGESLWRVSSTLFSNIQSDQMLEPLAPYDTKEAKDKWPSIKAGHMVQRELEAISLARTSGTKP